MPEPWTSAIITFEPATTKNTNPFDLLPKLPLNKNGYRITAGANKKRKPKK
jgi:hypothetical protein